MARHVSGRLSSADLVYVVVVAVGGLLVGLAVPAIWRFVPTAPNEFWLLAAVAVLSEVRPFTIPHPGGRPTRVLISLSIAFAVLLIWGAAAAIAVQLLAISISAALTRQPVRDWALQAAQLTMAFTAAGAVESRVDQSLMIGMGIDRFDVYKMLLPAVTWFVTYFALAALIRIVGRPAGQPVMAALRYDLLTTAALLAVAPLLISAPTGWSVVLLAVPLIGLNQVSRLLTEQEVRLRRDPVTGLRNTRGLVARADALPVGPDRYGLLLVNVGGLTYVTNNLGRAVTNRVLMLVGGRLSDVAGAGNDIGRVAEADFVILMPASDEAAATAMARVLAAELTSPIQVDGLPFPLEPTIGVAVAGPGEELSTVIGHAESAVMEAKSRGEPVRVFVPAAETDAQRRLQLLSDLRAAVQDPQHASEIALEYQPQVSIDTGRVVGVEALVRWIHPVRGLMDTGEAVEAAEPSGVMQLLTHRIIDDAVAQIAEWSRGGLDLRVSVNVSARDLASYRFAERVQTNLQRHGVRPDLLELEITEGALVADTPALTAAVADLAAGGVCLSLDDFGTGFASLQQLRRFPLNEVKIDKSYVGQMSSSAADRAVVTSICQLGRALRLRVVAEGVEDAQTARLLADLEDVIGQGWYFARPMPAAALVDWLRHRATTRAAT